MEIRQEINCQGKFGGLFSSQSWEQIGGIYLSDGLQARTQGGVGWGGGGGRSTPPETAGIDFYSGFRKNGQGVGVQIKIIKKTGIDFYSGFRKNDQGGCKSKS